MAVDITALASARRGGRVGMVASGTSASLVTNLVTSTSAVVCVVAPAAMDEAAATIVGEVCL